MAPPEGTSSPSEKLSRTQRRSLARLMKRKELSGGHKKKQGKGKPSSATSLPPAAAMSVYKRVPVLPPAFLGYKGPTDRFLQPGEPQYKEVLARSYQGFAVDPPSAFPSSFHSSFLSAFEDMEKRGMFLFDLTQPAGLNTRVARTFVTRCLVGEPGITYKYLGLRMFGE
jgi:hypothetical protein